MRIELNGKALVKPLHRREVGDYFMVLNDPRAIYQRVAGENGDDLAAVVIDSDGYLDARTLVTLPADTPVIWVSPVVIYRAV